MLTETLSGCAIEQIANKIVSVLKESDLSPSLAETVLEKAQREYQEIIAPSLAR